mgnify:CR=1 FL=1
MPISQLSKTLHRGTVLTTAVCLSCGNEKREADFMQKTQGSPLRRTGYVNFLRNIAIALGNANGSQEVITQLQAKLQTHNAMLDEHIHWAIAEQQQKLSDTDA